MQGLLAALDMNRVVALAREMRNSIGHIVGAGPRTGEGRASTKRKKRQRVSDCGGCPLVFVRWEVLALVRDRLDRPTLAGPLKKQRHCKLVDATQHLPIYPPGSKHMAQPLNVKLVHPPAYLPDQMITLVQSFGPLVSATPTDVPGQIIVEMVGVQHAEFLVGAMLPTSIDPVRITTGSIQRDGEIGKGDSNQHHTQIGIAAIM